MGKLSVVCAGFGWCGGLPPAPVFAADERGGLRALHDKIVVDGGDLLRRIFIKGAAKYQFGSG